MTPVFNINHRRNRQQVRRVLVAYRNRWRDLNASFPAELDLIVDRSDRLLTPQPCIFSRGRS
jgi:hypothetical protein